MNERKFTFKDWFMIIFVLGGLSLLTGGVIMSSAWDSVSERRLSMALDARGSIVQAMVTELDLRTTGLKVRTQYCAVSYTYSAHGQDFAGTEDLSSDYCGFLVEGISLIDVRYLPDDPAQGRVVKDELHWIMLGVYWFGLFVGSIWVLMVFGIIIYLIAVQLRLRRAS